MMYYIIIYYFYFTQVYFFFLSACFIIHLQKPADYLEQSRHIVIFGECIKKRMNLIAATWMTTTAN